MEIRNLITFLTVAEYRNFTRAAERLGYSQSAITVQIKHLEEELGVKLFDRIGKSVSITAYGKSFIDIASNAVEAMNKAVTFNANTSTQSGTVRIGVVGSILSSVFDDVLLEFGRRCPNVTVSVFEGSSAELEKKIRKSELDLAYFLDFKTPSEDWVRVREEKENIIFITNPSNEICKKEKITFADIVNERLILMPSGENYRTLFDNELVNYNLTCSPALEIVNTDLIFRLVRKSNFVSLMPEFAARRYIKAGVIAPLEVADVDLYQYSQLAYLRGKVITPHIRSFIDTILELT